MAKTDMSSYPKLSASERNLLVRRAVNRASPVDKDLVVDKLKTTMPATEVKRLIRLNEKRGNLEITDGKLKSKERFQPYIPRIDDILTACGF